MSRFLASKYSVPSHICWAFYGFWIISFSKLVNLTWGDERTFNPKFGTLSIPGDFRFWDMFNAFFSSSSAKCFPIPVHLLSHFLSPYFLSSLQTYYDFFLSPIFLSRNFFTVFRWCFFFHNLVFPYFSIESFAIRLEDPFMSVEFVTCIKSFFPLCFYLHFFL